MPARAANRAYSGGSGADGSAARPNMIMTGTGPFAHAGVTSTISIFTAIAGKCELST